MYIYRLQLLVFAARKICTVVILGLPTSEYMQLRWGQLFVNPYINPKLILTTLSPSIYTISMVPTLYNHSATANPKVQSVFFRTISYQKLRSPFSKMKGKRKLILLSLKLINIVLEKVLLVVNLVFFFDAPIFENVTFGLGKAKVLLYSFLSQLLLVKKFSV